MEQKKLVVFEGDQIRKTWHGGEWWFSVIDIVKSLTQSKDSKQYIKKMRQRDPYLESKWGTICTPLEITAQTAKRENLIV